ncbi:MAG: CRISPR-associated endoribonuclease Cas6 [Calditrichia bacterium]
MRIKLNLRLEENQPFPLNAAYPLMALIYRTLRESSSDYSEFLHQKGYISHKDKTFKFYTFSRIQVSVRRIIKNSGLLLPQNPRATWFVSSPVEEFVQHLIVGLFQKGYFQLNFTCLRGKAYTQRILVENVEITPNPSFSPLMHFYCLSPIVATIRPKDRSQPLYILADQPEDFSRLVHQNLKSKFQTLYGTPPPPGDFHLMFDQDYIQAHPKGGTVLEIHKNGIKHRGMLAPFTVSGPPELIRLGYETGFGEKNSMGFGCVEVV